MRLHILFALCVPFANSALAEDLQKPIKPIERPPVCSDDVTIFRPTGENFDVINVYVTAGSQRDAMTAGADDAIAQADKICITHWSKTFTGEIRSTQFTLSRELTADRTRVVSLAGFARYCCQEAVKNLAGPTETEKRKPVKKAKKKQSKRKAKKKSRS